MSKPIDRARELFEQMGHIADDEKCIELLAEALIHKPAGVAVPDVAGAVIKIAAALCTVALREIENAMDSPRLSRGRLENALAACKDRLGGYAIDLRRAAAPHPVSGEQKAEFFVDHAILRKALGMYGIAGPESDHELGDRMESYAVKVIKAVARLPFPAAQDVAGLVGILQRMLDQQHSLGRDSVLIREADVALAAHRAQQGEHPAHSVAANKMVGDSQ